MPGILCIANDKYAINLMDNLQLLLASEICREPDYAGGIERVFETRPAIVFLQHRIGEVSCDKMVKQVRALVDWDPVSLVLLSEDLIVPYSVACRFEACFDLCQPLNKLSRQVQQWLQTMKGLPWQIPETATVQPSEREPPGTDEITAAVADTGGRSRESEPLFSTGETHEGFTGNPPALRAGADVLGRSYPFELEPGTNGEFVPGVPGSTTSGREKARRNFQATATKQASPTSNSPPNSAAYGILAQDRKSARGLVICTALVLCIVVGLALWDLYTTRYCVAIPP